MTITEELDEMGIRVFEVCEGEYVAAGSAEEAISIMKTFTSEGILEEIVEVPESYYLTDYHYENQRVTTAIKALRELYKSKQLPCYFSTEHL